MKKNLLKRIMLAMALTIGTTFLSVSAATTPELKFTDARQLTVINEPQPGAGAPAFRRAVTANYPGLNSRQAELLNQSTGITILFKTDSPYIYAKWTTDGKGQGANMTAIAQRGLDLYIRENGKWKYAGVARPSGSYTKKEHQEEIIANMDGTMKECLLTLPVYETANTLEIGVAPSATIEPMKNPYTKRFLIAGSSITNGSGVARPGRLYSARLGRDLQVETPNLGLSGNWKLEPYLADLLCDCQADAIMIDGFSNPSAQEIRERLIPFVTRVRSCHKNIPIIFIQTLERDTRNFNLKTRAFEDEKRAAAEEMMAKVMKQFKNIYFINPGMPIGDDFDATVDGIHPSELGYQRMIDGITPQIRKILKAHNVIK